MYLSSAEGRLAEACDSSHNENIIPVIILIPSTPRVLNPRNAQRSQWWAAEVKQLFLSLSHSFVFVSVFAHPFLHYRASGGADKPTSEASSKQFKLWTAFLWQRTLSWLTDRVQGEKLIGYSSVWLNEIPQSDVCIRNSRLDAPTGSHTDSYNTLHVMTLCDMFFNGDGAKCIYKSPKWHFLRGCLCAKTTIYISLFTQTDLPGGQWDKLPCL